MIALTKLMSFGLQPTLRRLPTPGLAFGQYPQRAAEEEDPDSWQAWARRWASRLTPGHPRGLPSELREAYTTARAGLAATATLSPATARLRSHLRREGLSAKRAGQALAVASLAMQRTLGLQAHEAQVLAAWLMLQGRLVEMATGEGKTVAAALAAAVAGLAGTPVHLLTANEYLVQRDQAMLAPFYGALGLSSASITSSLSGEARSAAWRADIVYTTASQLCFDYLRDHLSQDGERDARLQRAQALAAADASGLATQANHSLLPGLCMGLVDEADSILLDEAVMPLILSAPAGELDVAAHQRAFELTKQLQRQRDYLLQPAQRRATLTAAGRDRVHTAVAGAGGELFPPRRACELVETALAARLLYRRDREYAVVNGELVLIDELTGRLATGRQWQGALHPMVQIKEGLQPSPPNRTAAQITYQRFFPRYLHLAGMSGTLLEARHELRQVYGVATCNVPLVRPSRRRWMGQRCYVDAASKWQAVVRTVKQVAGAGRPVLIGTDSVAASIQLSALLGAAGVAHQVLNATQDDAEAQKISRAGCAGQVTVATNMAGRGTDIRLDDAARAAGGLHVLATMRNRARRIDRQLMGRAARQGDPGSVEVIVALDDALLKDLWPPAVLRWIGTLANRSHERTVPTGLAGLLFGLSQRLTEQRDAQNRRELRYADQQAGELFGFSGGTE